MAAQCDLTRTRLPFTFFQNNTHQPGAANEAFGLTADQIKANGYIGGVNISEVHVSAGRMGMDGAILLYELINLGNSATNNLENPSLSDFVLTSTRIGNTVFMVGAIDGIDSGNTGFDATDDCRVILSVEY